MDYLKKMEGFIKNALVLIFYLPSIAVAQCPTVTVSIGNSVCLEEQVSIANSSSELLNFEWDFCAGSMENTPFISQDQTESPLNNPFDIAQSYDASTGYHAFIVNRGNGNLLRLDFGGNMSNEYAIVDLGDLGSLNQPQGISIHLDDGNWFGLVSSLSGNFWRLNFGSDLSNVPTVDDLGSFGFSNFGKIEIVEFEDQFLALSAGGGNSTPKLLTLDFGTSLTNIPSSDLKDISGGNVLFGLSLLYDCNSWFGFLGGFNSGLMMLNFGDDLNNMPSITNIGGVSNPRGVKVVEDGGQFYGIALTQTNSSVYRLDFGSSLSNTPTVNNLGDFGVLNTPIASMVKKDLGVFRIISAGFSNDRVNVLEFPKDCGASLNFSTEFKPTGVEYSVDGTYTISVVSNAGLNTFSSRTNQQITVSTDTAPSIDFSLDESRCVANINAFTPSVSGLMSYSWDFDGDGSTDSSLENPSHQFLTAGSYLVRLEVSDGICSNSVEKEVTIYEEPPLPDFDFLTSSLCTNSEISFINQTDNSGFTEILTFEWDFDGEAQSTEIEPEYTFLTPGSKTITLRSMLPGCEELYQEEIEIQTGPTAVFSYTNNCFGGDVVFNDESIGSISNEWNFGDLSPVVLNVSSPSHEFFAAGIYTVSLTVENSAGCQTTSSQDIEITDQPLADFTFDETIENLPVSFDAIDLTISDNSVDTWSWDFGGLGGSNAQSPSFTFSDPEDYTIELNFTTMQGCDGSISKIVTVKEAVCPTPSFSMLEDACIGEKLEISNGSVNSSNYVWDFCAGSIENTPVIAIDQTETILDNAFDIKKVFDNSTGYHVFLIGRGNGSLVRLDFGNSLLNTYTVVDLGNLGILDEPQGISIFLDNGNWFGFVSSLSGNIWRLNFGPNLINTPTVDDLGIFDDVVNLGKIEIVELQNQYLVISAGGGGSDPKILILDFGGSLANEPTYNFTDVASGGTLFGLSLHNDCGTWYGLLTGFDSGVMMLDFGSDLTNLPSITSIAGIVNPRGVKIIEDAGQFFGIVLTQTSSSLYRLDFGASLSNTPVINDLGNFDVLNTSVASEISQDSSVFRVFVAGFTNDRFNVLEFPKDCGASLNFSKDFEPNNIGYSSEGTHTIGLRAHDGLVAFSNSVSRQINISNQVAPSVNLITDDSRCLTNPNTFTPSLTGLTSYSWDFDGDNVEDSNLESPEYQFLVPGTYTIRLDISDGSCDNFAEQEITIYPEPPTPDFTAVSIECIDVPIAFTNNTIETGFEEVLIYAWDFNGEATSTEREPSFTFDSPGTKQITLTTQIPGCENTSSIFEMEISPGPTSAFSANDFSICEGEFITFADESTNGAVNWAWDFADGFTSTAQHPDHLFATAGNYQVSLTVQDAQGCESTMQQEVSVASLPVVTFDFNVACISAGGVQFFDESIVSGAEIISRTWYVDEAEMSTDPNPLLTFENEGTVNIRLETISSNGCESSFSEDIQILPTPQPNFSTNIGCEGEASVFTDLTSSPGNPVGTWLWSLDGATYNTQNIEHTFSGTGIFDVTLEVTGQNFCSEIMTQSIEILELPSVNFVVDGDCSNELITVTDASTVMEDPIVSRNWTLDGTTVGNGDVLFLESLPDATYELTLEVTTLAQCVTSTTLPLVINNAPDAEMSVLRDFGVPGDELTFTNASSGASNFQWFLDDVQIDNNPIEEAITFAAPGTYQVSLVASNDLGCSDTTTREVLIAIPVVDLAIGQFELIGDQGTGTIFLEVQNNGNLPVETTEVVVELQNQFSVTQQIESRIGIGETAVVSLSVGIPLASNELNYLCVTLNSQYQGFDDVNPLDNEKCITIQPSTTVEAPFPNPATTQTRVKLIAAEAGSAEISLFNSSGKIELNNSQEVAAGLNSYFIDLQGLQPGIYFVKIVLNGMVSVQRVIKL